MAMTAAQYWDDGLDWNKPDPTDWRYYQALVDALAERNSIIYSALSGATSEAAFPYRVNGIFAVNFLTTLRRKILNLAENVYINREETLKGSEVCTFAWPNSAGIYLETYEDCDMSDFPLPGMRISESRTAEYLKKCKNALNRLTATINNIEQIGHYAGSLWKNHDIDDFDLKTEYQTCYENNLNYTEDSFLSYIICHIAFSSGYSENIQRYFVSCDFREPAVSRESSQVMSLKRKIIPLVMLPEEGTGYELVFHPFGTKLTALGWNDCGAVTDRDFQTALNMNFPVCPAFETLRQGNVYNGFKIEKYINDYDVDGGFKFRPGGN